MKNKNVFTGKKILDLNYLVDKENLYYSGIRTQFLGSEEDLLALYLYNNRKFPTNHDAIIIGDDLWSTFINKDEYKAKLEADRDSYVWDNLIDLLCEDYFKDNYEFGGTLTEVEQVVRVMARENRFNRRILGKSFKEFLNKSDEIRSRAVPSLSGMMYVFLATPHGESRDSRMKELSLRCFVMRGLNPEHKTIIGIATEKYEKGKGYSLDTGYFHFPTLTPEDMEKIKEIQKDLGYFDDPRQQRIVEDEYPIHNIGNYMDYEKLAEKYKPKEINTLLVGESPPPNGKKYFYHPQKISLSKSIEDDRSLPSTIFYHYFKKRPKDELEYEKMLNNLKNLGIYLIDIFDKPIKVQDRNKKGGINRENLELIKNNIPKLRKKIQKKGISVADEDIIFLLARPHYKTELNQYFPNSKKIQWKKFRISK